MPLRRYDRSRCPQKQPKACSCKAATSDRPNSGGLGVRVGVAVEGGFGVGVWEVLPSVSLQKQPSQAGRLRLPSLAPSLCQQSAPACYQCEHTTCTFFYQSFVVVTIHSVSCCCHLQGAEPGAGSVRGAASSTQDRVDPNQQDFAAEMRAKAQSKRKAAAPAAVPVSNFLSSFPGEAGSDLSPPSPHSTLACSKGSLGET